MSREEQVLDLYLRFRLEDQLGYYEGAGDEYERAGSQALALSAVLLGLTAAVGALAGAEVGWKRGWAALAVILPAIATTLSAYTGLYAFDHLSKLYQDAARALRAMSREAQDLVISDPEMRTAAVHEFVQRAEGVFRKEQGQWGQLMSQLQLPDNPKEP
ncbi:MAG TPA: SLATT domain-containing protein [Actinomycetota bacterium]|jgi:hypothetical protein